jgi:CubicO group peptidase (beta-lactamase class C family)
MRRRLVGLVMLVGFGVIGMAGPVRAQARPLDGLDGYIENALKQFHGVGLAVAIVKDDSIVYARGFGVKKVGDPAPVTPKTVFAIGSTTKAFTAAALGMLVDEGKIGWDDKVTDRLPGFQLFDPAVTREIAIRDLLTHRSGLNRGDRLWMGSTLTRDQVIHQVRYHKPAYSFRTTWSYQNIMFLSAGQIVPAVTATSWDDFLKTRIFQPLGMTSTSTSIRDLASQPDVATPHDQRGGAVVAIPYRNIDNIGPAGSINSNVLDMAQWIRFHLNGGKVGGRELLKPKTEQELFTVQMPMRPESEIGFLYPGAQFLGYGLGWILFDEAGRKVAEHSGGIDGMLTELMLVPSEHLGVIVLSNNGASLVAFPLARGIINRYLGVKADPVAAMAPLVAALATQRQAIEDSLNRTRAKDTKPSLPLDAYAGEYSDPMYGTARVTVDGAKLVFKVESFRDALVLDHWHYDTFRGPWGDPTFGQAMATFRLDARGKVAGVTVEGLEYEFLRVVGK